VIDTAISELAPTVGTSAACVALGVSRAGVYRRRRPKVERAQRGGGMQPRALTSGERAAVLTALHLPRFVDHAPSQVYATLLDEGTYLASQRTMYRILSANSEVRERRDQLCRPAYRKPELLAVGPNSVWSWDITKLLGPQKWTYFYLYVILDIFSRYVVGWMVAQHENALLAQQLIRETLIKQGITAEHKLTIHADNGSPMIAKTTALLMSDLGINKSHSRPHVSNDNPFSESQFKTLKYRPAFPDRFGCVEDSRLFCGPFFNWYNVDHRHSGLGLHTPESVHYGTAAGLREQRATVLTAAFAAHPERFVRFAPTPPPLPTAVWINPPTQKIEVMAASSQ
jgi:putative transposase